MEIIKGLLILIFLNLMENILLGTDVEEIKMATIGLLEESDDVIIVSGHNLGTAEIESAFGLLEE